MEQTIQAMRESEDIIEEEMKAILNNYISNSKEILKKVKKNIEV